MRDIFPSTLMYSASVFRRIRLCLQFLCVRRIVSMVLISTCNCSYGYMRRQLVLF